MGSIGLSLFGKGGGGVLVEAFWSLRDVFRSLCVFVGFFEPQKGLEFLEVRKLAILSNLGSRV